MQATLSVPGYRLDHLLHSSSRTLVYRGVKEHDQQPVVVKLLKNPYPSAVELMQFRNQYIIAKALDSPGVVRFYNLSTEQTQFALIMEDFGGISLKEYINCQAASLELAAKLMEFLHVAIAVADILHDIYQHRIIHKDIKPSNILINPETKQVKLIDFSIASLLPRETQALTSPDVLEGTLAYLSPEQTGRMNRGIDYRTDFYSLGVTFYELLTGQLPFQVEDAMELIHCHIAKQPVPPCEVEGWSKGARERGRNGAREMHGQNYSPAPLLPCSSSIPTVLSDIVMKLMAKNAEDRYQSALGLKYDLEQCLYQLKETGRIESFPLAQRDVCDRFSIPEKLYGREQEVDSLLAAFDRVKEGATELMLVAGFSGIGKTAVVNEVHKPIVRQRGYFIQGKFDQLQRNIPFSAFVQAFRDLMRQLLTESEAQLERWKLKMLRSLGENAQVIIDVIPELEQIIGAQPAAPELSGVAAQTRFNLLFQKFTQVFTTQEHPLVIFLDDLQWADLASLKLMQTLCRDVDTQYLLLIGAYRDNEVSSAHPLMLAVEELRQAEVVVNAIALASLSQFHLNHLVADTLHYSADEALPLTQLVHQKTQGNPFFSSQFLKSLYQDELLIFDTSQGKWQYDLAGIQTAALTDDIVQFVACQLQKLPATTQEVLKLAACIGNTFDLATLSIVYGQSFAETAAELWSALEEGLIVPTNDAYKAFQDEVEHSLNGKSRSGSALSHLSADQLPTYKFLHDRIQQAAYSLIPADQKQVTHLQIGQRLLCNTSAENWDEKLFEIVNSLNIGAALITEQGQREDLARLNLQAGQKAKAATAFGTALEYCQAGIALLPTDGWHSQYDLTLALHEIAAEAAYLCGEFEAMEQLTTAVMNQATALLDQVNVYDIRVQAYTAQNDVLAAIATARQAMSLFGVNFPDNPTPADIQQALQETTELANSKSLDELLNLPIMTDAEKLAVMRIAVSVAPAVYIAMPNLFALLTLSQVKASVEFGNTPFSAFFYACYGIPLSSALGNIAAADKFGKVALGLNEIFNISALQPTTLYVVGAFLVHQTSHLQDSLQLMLDGYQLALETGNLYYVGFNTKDICQYSYFMGQELTSLEQDMQAYGQVLANFKQITTLNYCRIYHQAVLNLLGQSENPSSMRGSILDEDQFLPQLQTANEFTGLHYFHLHKLILCYLFGDLPRALKTAAQSRDYLAAGTGYATEPTFYFYDSLTALAAYPTASSSEQAELLNRVADNQVQLERRADHAPMNYRHKFDLVAAERNRILQQNTEALEAYDCAIAGAKEHGFVQDEALANELAARFYLDWGKDKIAQVYLAEAYYAYVRWGATAKVQDLEARHSNLLTPMLHQEEGFTSRRSLKATTTGSGTSGSTSVSDMLDLATVMKSSQALSGEIQLDTLLSTLMQVLIENAGAETCALLLRQDGEWIVSAQGMSHQPTVFPNHPLADSQSLAQSVVNYVIRTSETLVLDSACTETTFANDAYILAHQPKSILCTPVRNRGRVIGILYLENKLANGAFTHNRLEVLRLLTAQAAISLQNALLYNKLAVAKEQLEEYSHTLEQKVEQRTQELNDKNQCLSDALEQLQQAQTQLIQTEKMSSLGQMVAGIAHEINNPINFIYGNLTHADGYCSDLLGLVDCYQQHYPEPVAAIADEMAAIEFDFLKDDLHKLLQSMKVGADRIRQIVLSLRNFSRLDEAEMKPVDIHEGIDSTLLILHHRIKGNDNHSAIQIVKEYGSLPKITCFASQLNQVFMNILSNALDALELKSRKLPGVKHKAEAVASLPTAFPFASDCTAPTIRIRTAMKDDTVHIWIADNGSGIPEKAQSHLFDPFFTTKEIGKGTGLGLSISYSIVVDKHGGQLSVVSEPGQGTEFAIAIPRQ